MLRQSYLSIFIFCILLTASKCTDGCESPNTGVPERLAQLEGDHRELMNNSQDLTQQSQDLAEQRDAILEAKKDLDRLMALKDQLETGLAKAGLAKLQASQASQQASQTEIEAIRQQLQEVKNDIADKTAEIGQLEKIQKYQFDILEGKVDNTNETLQETKADLEAEINKMKPALDSFAKTDDLDPIKQDINKLQKDLEEANAKLKQAASKDHLDGITGRLGKQIQGIQNNLTTTKGKLRDEIQDSKTKAITEASGLASKMVEAANQELAQVLANQEALQKTIDALKNAQKGKSEAEQKELKTLQDECKKLSKDIDNTNKLTGKAFKGMKNQTKKIQELEQKWDAANKSNEDALKKANQQAKKALDSLEKLKKSTPASKKLNEEEINELLDKLISAREQAEKAKLGLSDANGKSIQTQALELAQQVNKQLESIRLEIGTINSKFSPKDPLSPRMQSQNNNASPWTNGTAQAFKDYVLELQRNMAVLNNRLNVKEAKNLLSGENEYEERLKKLETEVKTIKQKEEEVKRLNRNSKSFNRSGSFIAMHRSESFSTSQEK